MSIDLKQDKADVVYYNASLFNPGSGQPIPAAVDDIRSQPIIRVPDDFECSVVRFDLSANLLPPVVVPMPQPPVVGPSVPTNLVVTLTYLGLDYQATVLIDVVSAATYGFIFSIDTLVTAINTALATAFALIPAPSSSAPPVLAFNPVTQLLTLYYQDTYVTAGAPVGIFVNSALYNYLVSIPAFFVGYNTPSGKDFQIQVGASSAIALPAVGSRQGLPVTVQTIAGNLRGLSQAGPSLNSWNGVRSLIITTSMPINSESLPTNSLPGQNANYSSNSLPILSDFVLGAEPSTNPVVDRITVEYLPTAEYRMVQMRGGEALKRVDLKWFFTLFDGTIREVYIPPGGYCSAKLLFRRSHLRLP